MARGLEERGQVVGKFTSFTWRTWCTSVSAYRLLVAMSWRRLTWGTTALSFNSECRVVSRRLRGAAVLVQLVPPESAALERSTPTDKTLQLTPRRGNV